ncbi:MAG: preprotein translocase subunit Sec61beta [Thermoplasmata archaeon HGW-Thermoplasmata-1]|nr:MAG: preprotein translocase subunit Sec61beta [Thermoplasmata archaeon HGW-Thermoplasmata-1]
MAKQKKGEGFHSSAGLIRYFDAEEKTSLRISPKAVVIVSALVAVVLLVLGYALKF